MSMSTSTGPQTGETNASSSTALAASNAVQKPDHSIRAFINLGDIIAPADQLTTRCGTTLELSRNGGMEFFALSNLGHFFALSICGILRDLGKRKNVADTAHLFSVRNVPIGTYADNIAAKDNYDVLVLKINKEACAMLAELTYDDIRNCRNAFANYAEVIIKRGKNQLVQREDEAIRSSDACSPQELTDLFLKISGENTAILPNNGASNNNLSTNASSSSSTSNASVNTPPPANVNSSGVSSNNNSSTNASANTPPPARINPIFPQLDEEQYKDGKAVLVKYISRFLAAPKKNEYIKVMEDLLQIINNTNNDTISGANRKLYYALYYECLEEIFSRSGQEFYPPDYRYDFQEANNEKPIFYRAQEVGSNGVYTDIDSSKEAMNLLQNIKRKNGQNKKTHMTVSQPVYVIDKSCKLPAESTEAIYLDTADGKTIVLSDIHATLRPGFLMRILSNAMDQGKRVVILGDSSNRGAYTMETLLILFAFRLKFPDKVFLMRGNHESSAIVASRWETNTPKDFYDRRAFILLLEKMFAKLPIFCIPLTQDSGGSVKLVYCVHGACSPMHLLLQRKEWFGVGLLTVMTGAGLATNAVIKDTSLFAFAPLKFNELSDHYTGYAKIVCGGKLSQQDAFTRFFGPVAGQDHPLWNENPFSTTTTNVNVGRENARCERETGRGGAGRVTGIETLASLDYASSDISTFIFGHNHKLSAVKLPNGSQVFGVSSCGYPVSRDGDNQLFSWATINESGVATAHAISYAAESDKETMFGNNKVTNDALETLAEKIVNPTVDLAKKTGFVIPEEVKFNRYETNMTNLLVYWASTLSAKKVSSSSATLSTSLHTLYGASSTTNNGYASTNSSFASSQNMGGKFD